MKRARDDEDVPKLPRGKGLALSGPMMMRIGMTSVALIAIVALQRPCSSAIGHFVTSFGEGSASPAPSGSSAAPASAAGGAAATGAAATGAAATGAAADTAGAAPATPADLSQYEVLTPSMTDDELRAAIERAERRAKAARELRAAQGATGTPATATAEPATTGTTEPATTRP